ncbi:MAG: hypothetical protein J6B04_02450 [Clostridia bacterium]|nr:hypothetical protein [Clostridia bacterium]
MDFDIISLSEEEAEKLTLIQLKLLRTAQQKKNALYHELEQNALTYKNILAANNVENSTLYNAKLAELKKEFDYQVEILKEQLIFNMSLKEPTVDEETGGSTEDGNAPYIVDYSLSYLERYVIVRDYYMTIEDPVERLAIYQADEVAVSYLNTYYNTLYDYLTQFT